MMLTGEEPLHAMIAMMAFESPAPLREHRVVNEERIHFVEANQYLPASRLASSPQGRRQNISMEQTSSFRHDDATGEDS
jgi:hypothetical protein